MHKEATFVVYYVTMKDTKEKRVETDHDPSGREINSDKMLKGKLIEDFTQSQNMKSFSDKRFRDIENQEKDELEVYREKMFLDQNSPKIFNTTKHRPKSAGRSLHRIPKYTGDSDSDSDVFDGDIEVLDLDSLGESETTIDTARIPKPPDTERNTNLWTPRDARNHGNDKVQSQPYSGPGHGSAVNHESTQAVSTMNHGEVPGNGILRIKRKHLRRRYCSDVDKIDEAVMECRQRNISSPHQSASDDSDISQSVEIVTMQTLVQRRKSTGRGELISPDQSDLSGSPRDADLIPTELYYQGAAAKALERITRRASDSANMDIRRLDIRHYVEPQQAGYNTLPIEPKPKKVRPQIPRKLKPLFNHPEPPVNVEQSVNILKEIKREETVPFTREMYEKKEQANQETQTKTIFTSGGDLQRQRPQNEQFVVSKHSHQSGNDKTLSNTKPISQRRKLQPVQPLHTLPSLESSDIQQITDKLHIINSPLTKMAPIGPDISIIQYRDELRATGDAGSHGNTTNSAGTVVSEDTVNEPSTKKGGHKGTNNDRSGSIGRHDNHKTIKTKDALASNGSGGIPGNKPYSKKTVSRTKSAPD